VENEQEQPAARTPANPPQGWDKNVIAEFLDKVRTNQYATFYREGALCQILTSIEEMYLRALKSINYTKHGLYAAFLARSHSSYLAACNLSWAVQNAETFALLRLSLESAMYGLFMTKDDERFRIWLNRHKDEKGRTKVRNAFPNWALLKMADDLGERDASRFRAMYEETIDRGAHPNEMYLTAHMDIERKEDGVDIQIEVLGSGGAKLRHLLICTARTGVCSLMLFNVMYADRFSEASLDREIVAVRDLLWSEDTCTSG
jgi:hypothetical protein